VFEIKNPYFTEQVKSIEVKEKSISELLKEMTDTGFQGRKLGEVVDVWERMIKDKDTTIIMGIAGSGMHIHQSLFDIETKRNAFYDENDKYGSLDNQSNVSSSSPD